MEGRLFEHFHSKSIWNAFRVYVARNEAVSRGWYSIALPHTTLLNVRVPFFGILNVCNMGGKKKITTPLFFCIFLFSFFLFSWHWFWIVKKKRESHPNSYYIFFLFIEFIFFSFKKFPSFSTNLYGCGKKKKEKKKKRLIRGKRK